MKAVVYHGPNQMKWQDWPEPEVKLDEVVVAVRACAVCGSDLHGYTGESGRRIPPMIMGHEATGEVVEVGPGVDSAWMGARVHMFPAIYCGRCPECQEGFISRCLNRRALGNKTTNGAFADLVAVPAKCLRRLPDQVSFVHGTLAEPLAIALHASRRAGDLAGQSVLVVGCGPIGLLIAVWAMQAGARHVVSADLLPIRRSAAIALGTTTALNPAAEGWKEELAEATGKPAVDVAIDAVGAAAAFQTALEALRPGGTAVAVGGWRPIPLDIDRLMHLELRVHGSFGCFVPEFEESCVFLEQKCFDPDHVISDVLPLSEGVAVFADLVAGTRPDMIKPVLVPDHLLT